MYTSQETPILLEMSDEQKEELRHQMYAWCISNGLVNDKEEAKTLLKQNGFLLQKIEQKPKPNYNLSPKQLIALDTRKSRNFIRNTIKTWTVDEQLLTMSDIALHLRTIGQENQQTENGTQ